MHGWAQKGSNWEDASSQRGSLSVLYDHGVLSFGFMADEKVDMGNAVRMMVAIERS